MPKQTCPIGNTAVHEHPWRFEPGAFQIQILANLARATQQVKQLSLSNVLPPSVHGCVCLLSLLQIMPSPYLYGVQTNERLSFMLFR